MRTDDLIKEWYYGDVKKLIVVIRDGKGEREIRGEEIKGVKKDGFFWRDTFIPAHRIKRIKRS